MTVSELQGPGLTETQWQQIKALATSLDAKQLLWVSGFLAGIEHRRGAQDLSSDAMPTLFVGSAASSRRLTVLYGSESGNSAALARSLVERARGLGLRPDVADMADYKPRKLKDEQDLLIVTSTHGEGDPPQSAKAFFEFLESRKAPQLPGIRYAVLALGNSTYEHYCEAGKRLDRRLAEMGAIRLEPRIDCDVDYDEVAAAWAAKVVAALDPAISKGVGSGAAGALPAAASIPLTAPVFDKRRPFKAPVIDNIALTGRGSSKETRHIELSLADSGLAFEPGDALAVLPRNDPALIAAILNNLSLSFDAPVTVKERATTLGKALATDFEISAATPRFIDHWAKISGAAELEGLHGEGQAGARAVFLRGHHVIDIMRRFPVKGIDPQTLLAGFRPLLPRLYSIASSQAATPDEAHLTVTMVRYELHGESRVGVASGYFAESTEPDSAVPVYIQPNPHFRLADDDAPILMIGAGTGVAPYRAFLQERDARGAKGKCWLVFGERNFHTDFLYQTEWQEFLKDGVLSRMNVAFSRDQSPKTYVQHRLREHAHDVYAWLEEGAHIYVCGDAANLAPDVHAALGAIIQQESSRGRAAADEYLGALQREHRYQIDVY